LIWNSGASWLRYWAGAAPGGASPGARWAGHGADAGTFQVEPVTSSGAQVRAAGTFHVEPVTSPPVTKAPTAGIPMAAGLPSAAKVLAIANQKGGVGKTTTAVSVAAAVADLGGRTLLVDLDPQGNATSGVGHRIPHGQPTIYEVLVDGREIEDAVEPTGIRNLSLVPANINLAGAEVELVSVFSREQRLRRSLSGLRDAYDVILIDCPPSLGLLTVNALTAADHVLVPIQCEYYALEGLGALQRNIELIRTHLNPDLSVAGYVMTMLDARTRLSQQVVDDVRAHFGELVFKTRVPRSVRLAEAPSFGKPITAFDPTSRGAMAYRRLAMELLDRLGLPFAGGGASHPEGAA
jgi:chromosome partitioning protein